MELDFDPGPIPVALHAAIDALALAHQQSDPETAVHCERTAGIASALGELLGLSEVQSDFVWMAAVVHDIGKQRLSREIMLKRGALTQAERATIRTHSALGRDVVGRVHARMGVVVHQHHERLDGSGYPRGLHGLAILPEARILAVADVVEAMMSPRPYRPALALADVVAELSRQRGRQLDPEVVDAAVRWLTSEQGHDRGEPALAARA